MSDCNQKVYEHGKTFAVIHGPAELLEYMVKLVRNQLGAAEGEVDWHFVGGWGCFKTLGDVKAAKKAMDLVMPLRRPYDPTE